MYGNGCNDCGTLKTARVKIALSDVEESIVSPFTSLDKSITSVVEVLKEGRCALASASASHKYIIIYGQIRKETPARLDIVKRFGTCSCSLAVDELGSYSGAFAPSLSCTPFAYANFFY
jgi:hypothetical protein